LLEEHLSRQDREHDPDRFWDHALQRDSSISRHASAAQPQPSRNASARDAVVDLRMPTSTRRAAYGRRIERCSRESSAVRPSYELHLYESVECRDAAMRTIRGSELPDPITKLTWGTPSPSPPPSPRGRLEDGDVVAVSVDVESAAGTVRNASRLPVCVQPDSRPDISIALATGRTHVGRVGGTSHQRVPLRSAPPPPPVMAAPAPSRWAPRWRRPAAASRGDDARRPID